MSATCCSDGCPVCNAYNSSMVGGHIKTINLAAKELEDEKSRNKKEKSIDTGKEE